MLEKLTIDMFAPHVGEMFRLRVQPERVLDVELVQVTPLRVRSADGREAPRQREPFSIVFRGPSNVIVPQRVYPLEHDTMGSYELFIVPIGPGQGGMLYEAIFS
jgi:hypothetical protein